MSEVLIRRPQINKEEERWRRFSSHEGRKSAERWMNLEFPEHRINPMTHPNVIELAAGDGPIAWLLVNRGWKAENITCVDMYMSPSPMIPRAKWVYLNLSALYDHIWDRTDPEYEVLQMKGIFDLVTFCNSGKGIGDEEQIAEYFKRPGGYAFRIY